MAQPTARVLVLGLLLAALEACTGPLELAQVQQDVQAVPGGVDLGTVAFGETSPSVPIRLVPDFNESLEILAITSNCGAVTVTPGALPTYIFFFNDPMFGAFYVEHVFEVGLHEGVGTGLDHDRRVFCRLSDARVNPDPVSVLVEERGKSPPRVRDMLDQDDGHALGLGRGDRLLDVGKRGVGVPQRILASWKIVVLNIDDQQSLLHITSRDI